MQNIRIYAAPSLSVIMDQLSIYRSTGVLTLWHAADERQEGPRITIELGRPLHIYGGSYWENVTESVLAWLNTWGEIHFSFQPTEARLQLPPPSPSIQELSLPYDPLRQGEQINYAANGYSSPEPANEKAIASLTTFGRSYAAANLPRYDRTVFLLINGRRTVSDLTQLIRRSPEEIFTSLHRLQDLQLITFEALAPEP